MQAQFRRSGTISIWSMTDSMISGSRSGFGMFLPGGEAVPNDSGGKDRK
jgi:hypothetical protein